MKTVYGAAALALALVLAGCGGSGSSGVAGASSAKTTPASVMLAGETGSADTDPVGSAQTKTTPQDESIQRPLALSPFDRSRTYELYASNGSIKTLRLDLSNSRYEILDGRQSTSGAFAEAADEPGAYVFDTARTTPNFNTARFRLTEGAAVGAFPFEVPGAGDGTYEVVPFVAVNDFLTEVAQLDGEYNRVSVSRSTNGARATQVQSFRISDAGTVLEMCVNNVVYRIDWCPTDSVRRYSVAPAGSGRWVATDATTNATMVFRIARVGGKSVWLSGGPTPNDPATQQLGIGLEANTVWPSARYSGGSTAGTWGISTIKAEVISRAERTSSGSDASTTGSISEWPLKSPAGLRTLGEGASGTLAMQNNVLVVVAGSRDPSRWGYLEIGLFKDNADIDPRNGTYKVFTSTLAVYEMTVDFDARTYKTSELGNDDAGTFTPDPLNAGTYVIQSSRISGTVNTARFRAIPDGLVGTFPFAGFPTPRPFIGARSFVTNRRELAGVYDGLVAAELPNTNYLAPGFQLDINSAGTSVQQCAVLPVSTCAASAGEQPVEISSFAGWRGGAAIWTFHVAKFGSRRVLLDATAMYEPDGALLHPVLVVALSRSTNQSSWLAPQLQVFAGDGRVGSGALTDTVWTATLTGSDGIQTNFALPLELASTNPSYRLGSASGQPYFAIQNGLLRLALPQNGAASGLQFGVQ